MKGGGYVVRLSKQWSLGPSVRASHVFRAGNDGWVVFARIADQGVCPGCKRRSRHSHGWRERRLQDFAWQGERVTIRLRSRRWRCIDTTCRRQTFSDQCPDFVSPFARRTNRAAQIARLLAYTAGGRPSERIMRCLGMPVSNDTILRLLKRGAEAPTPPPKVVGIDDWSWRKNSRYGTILVDLERRSVVDILEDRGVESSAGWLRRRPSIEVVSRDRCGLFAQAVRKGAPQAVQTADRFHLVQNLRLAIEEQMSMEGRATGRSLLPDDESSEIDAHRRRARMAHRKSRDEVFATIHALRDQGLSYSEIERRTGHKRRTVAKWLTFQAPPDRRRASLKPSSPRFFETFLADRWKEGNRLGRHLFHDIKLRGYTGSISNLERLLGAWRRAENPTNDEKLVARVDTSSPVKDPDTGHAISPVIAAALCMKPRGLLSARQTRKVDALKCGSHAFATMRGLAMRFRGILRASNVKSLDTWIDDAIETDLIPIMRFASSLRRDIDAVHNAIALPWSNGQVEGQVNRLKTIKRAMYGRAGAELLRARMLPLLHTE